jgi:hypothetical protein
MTPEHRENLIEWLRSRVETIRFDVDLFMLDGAPDSVADEILRDQDKTDLDWLSEWPLWLRLTRDRTAAR